MKNRSGEKIKLASIDELLGVVNEESAMEIEISKIHPFKNHPFKVLDDEKMQDLVESVRINGVLTPVLLRMDDNEEYEMVSGHRRMHAAQLAGLTTIPAIVRELSDDDAVIAMVDANIQREELLPSEKAFAYKMKLDAMKHQGKRLSDDSLSDNEAEVLAGNEANHMTLSQVGPKCNTDGDGRANNSGNRANEVVEEHSMMNSNELLARQVGESVAQIKRYIRLTNLIPKILAMVDEGKIAFTIGV